VNWEAAGAIGEIAGALAVVLSLVYLARQVGMSNRLARAEAYRMPNSELNSINSGFGTDPTFRAGIRQVLNGASRTDLGEDERILVDYYLFSITNTYVQLAREVKEGILAPEALDFGGKGLFLLPYYRTSWSLYRDQLPSTFVQEFERRHKLAPSVEAVW
jgi:hypothetical protein